MLSPMVAGVIIAALIAPCGAFAMGPALIAPCVALAGGPFCCIPAVRRPQAALGALPRMVESAPLVVVAGATGRVGRLVVQRLLNPPFNSTQTPVRVRALVRDLKKAESVLPQDPSLEIVRCDLLSAAQIKAACGDAAAAVWCATGFSDSQDASLVSKLMGAFKLKFTPQESVDISAMKAMGACFKDRQSPLGGPSIVMCSSAGVTRPTWPEDKKQRLFWRPPSLMPNRLHPPEQPADLPYLLPTWFALGHRYSGAADIPIVRLNPLGILDVKRQGEEALRNGGASYVIVRPCGLNDKWPSGRPIMSQGDVAVGRINRGDVAQLLTRMVCSCTAMRSCYLAPPPVVSLAPHPCPRASAHIDTPTRVVRQVFESAAAGRTFETIALPGYPTPRDFGLQLQRLTPDADLTPADGLNQQAALDAQYALLQQLVPGETLQPNQLAMGQTYEQLDRGEQGRLGVRGKELPPIVRSESAVR
jgi:hypothetical protein